MAHTVETKVNLDANVLAAAEQYAERNGVSLGSVISDALRQSLKAAERDSPAYRNGIRLIRGGQRGPTVTVNDVNAILDDLD